MIDMIDELDLSVMRCLSAEVIHIDGLMANLNSQTVTSAWRDVCLQRWYILMDWWLIWIAKL